MHALLPVNRFTYNQQFTIQRKRLSPLKISVSCLVASIVQRNWTWFSISANLPPSSVKSTFSPVHHHASLTYTIRIFMIISDSNLSFIKKIPLILCYKKEKKTSLNVFYVKLKRIVLMSRHKGRISKFLKKKKKIL